jgi:hypothetical protein
VFPRAFRVTLFCIHACMSTRKFQFTFLHRLINSGGSWQVKNYGMGAMDAQFVPYICTATLTFGYGERGAVDWPRPQDRIEETGFECMPINRGVP